ncbi:protein XRI1-like, partial [Trifolium medium]|nr:protein XRI1-like [Trifolium medium]
LMSILCPMEYALENASSSNFEDLESAEKWFADCFKDTEMQLCPDNPNSSGADDVHINATGMRHCLLPTIVF